jgi:hypothetical protein
MNHGVLQGFSSVPRNTEQKVYGAGIVTDPRHMPFGGRYEALYYKTAAGTQATLAMNTQIPTEFINTDVSSTSAIVTANVTGSGFLSHYLSGFTNTGDTLTVIIVVDGISYTFTNTYSLANMLMSLGYLAPATDAPGTNTVGGITTYNSNNLPPFIGNYRDTGFSQARDGKWALNTAPKIIPTYSQIASMGLPRLRFEKSLLITERHSVAAGTTNYARANYQLD